MKFDLNSKKQNLIYKAILKCKSDKNSIFKVKGYVKTVDTKISKISIIINNYINKVYAKPNKIFSKIKDTSKRAKN